MSIWVPQHIPSWKQGFARHRHKSPLPQIWGRPVGAWHSELGPTGQRLQDISGRKNHGTLLNMNPSTAWVPGSNGWGLNFISAAINQYVICDGTQMLTNMTVLARVKPNALNAGWDTIASTVYWDTATGWLLVLTLTSVQFYARPGIFISHNMSPQNAEHTYAATVSDSGGRLYVDGKLVGSDPGTWTDSNLPVRIGARAQNSGVGVKDPFGGRIDFVRLFDRVLTETEIQKASDITNQRVMLSQRTLAFPKVGISGQETWWYYVLLHREGAG